ncbi:MAG TPA: hypothetical protein VHD62_05690 [Opitutaceae bacterium]|nr:hypothetical protein [Opitutaceae bacterium]
MSKLPARRRALAGVIAAIAGTQMVVWLKTEKSFLVAPVKAVDLPLAGGVRRPALSGGIISTPPGKRSREPNTARRETIHGTRGGAGAQRSNHRAIGCRSLSGIPRR